MYYVCTYDSGYRFFFAFGLKLHLMIHLTEYIHSDVLVCTYIDHCEGAISYICICHDDGNYKKVGMNFFLTLFFQTIKIIFR